MLKKLTPQQRPSIPPENKKYFINRFFKTNICSKVLSLTMCVRELRGFRLTKQDDYFCMKRVVVFLTTGVNFFNILLELFSPLFCAKKLQIKNVT